jgi:hypothetical protein
MAAALFSSGFIGMSAHSQTGASTEATPAVTPAQDTTIHRHLGFFLRPDLGVGYMTSSAPTGTSAGDLTVSGPSGVFGFVIGGTLTENVILGAHLYDSVVVNPTVSLSTGQSASSSNTSLTMYGIGPEFTYYWMPSNVYLSATAALTRLAMSANGRDSTSNVGFGMRVAVGKEWWVSDHWGLGLVGQTSFSSNQDSGSGNPPTITTWVFSLSFSATYN